MKKLICFGDSITDCGRLWDNPPLGVGYVSMLDTALKENSSGSWSVLNFGFDGFTVSRVLDQARQLSSPAGSAEDIWVTLLVGINDVYQMLCTGRPAAMQEKMMDSFCGTYDRLLSVLNTFLFGNGRLILMEPFVFPLPQSNRLWLPTLAKMSSSIKDLASKHQALWLPLQEDLLHEAAIQGLGNITLDGIHLTRAGQKFLAEKLYQIIG